MKYLLSGLLIISLLTSSLAWAWDSHSEALTGHVSSASSILSSGGETPVGDPPLHDHDGCHGVMDLLGISLFVAMVDLFRAGRSAFPDEASLATYISLLPTKPPRV